MKISMKAIAVLAFATAVLFLAAAALELYSAHRERALTESLMAAFFAIYGAARLKSWRARQAVAGPVHSP